MFYIKKFSLRERVLWFLLAVAMLTCGGHYLGRPSGLALLAVGSVVLATSLIGFCPGCALAGVRLRSRARRQARAR